MASIRPATKADLFYLAPRLRAADRQECLAATGLPPEIYFPTLLKRNRQVWVGCPDGGRPATIFGVSPVKGFEHVGVIWLLGTDTIFSRPVEFLKTSRKWVDKLHRDYLVLTNVLDARNTAHQNYIKRLGFSIIRKIPKYGPFSLPFYEFVRIKT